MDFRINSYYFTAELWLIILYNNNGVFTVRYEGNLLRLIQVNFARCFFPLWSVKHNVYVKKIWYALKMSCLKINYIQRNCIEDTPLGL